MYYTGEAVLFGPSQRMQCESSSFREIGHLTSSVVTTNPIEKEENVRQFN